MRVHNKILKLFQCHKCPRQYTGKSKLDHHIKLKHEEINQLIKCNECYKTYPMEHLLKLHKSRVHIIPAYECKICNASFKNNSKLQRHNTSVAHKSNVFKNAMQMEGHVKIAQFK